MIYYLRKLKLPHCGTYIVFTDGLILSQENIGNYSFNNFETTVRSSSLPFLDAVMVQPDVI